MKQNFRDQASYIGAGAGLIGFAVYGLLPGSMIGGMLGLTLAGQVAGTPVEPGVLARLTVTLSMLVGVLLSGLVFTAAGATLGWVAGAFMNAITSRAGSGVTAAISGR